MMSASQNQGPRDGPTGLTKRVLGFMKDENHRSQQDVKAEFIEDTYRKI